MIFGKKIWIAAPKHPSVRLLRFREQRSEDVAHAPRAKESSPELTGEL